MAEEQINPLGAQQPQPQPQWAGMTTITPQGGQEPYAEGSNFQLSPEAMQMMWAPQAQAPSLFPQQQPQQINPYA